MVHVRTWPCAVVRDRGHSGLCALPKRAGMIGRQAREVATHKNVREWDVAAKCVRDNVVLWCFAE